MATSTMEKVTNNSGSNANGSYCKMPDGTLICYGDKSNLSSGGQIDFPVAFTEVPIINVTPVYNDVGTARCIMSVAGFTKYIFKVYAYTFSGAESTSNILRCHWIAIGRWK